MECERLGCVKFLDDASFFKLMDKIQEKKYYKLTQKTMDKVGLLNEHNLKISMWMRRKEGYTSGKIWECK